VALKCTPEPFGAAKSGDQEQAKETDEWKSQEIGHAHAVPIVGVAEQKGSSNWLKTQGQEYRGFHWQAGYGAFSVSQSHAEQVRSYIGRQEEHHRKQSFQGEFLAFLNRYGIEYDERFLWS
jgi:hypothetical protein